MDIVLERPGVHRPLNFEANESVFNRRNIKMGALLLGGVATAYLAYNNLDLLVNTTKSLWARAVAIDASLATKLWKILETIWAKSSGQVYALTQYIITTIRNAWQDWLIAISQLSLQTFGTTNCLSGIISQKTLLLAKKLLNNSQFDRLQPITRFVALPFVGCFSGFVSLCCLACALIIIYESTLIINQIRASNNRWLICKFLIGGWRKVDIGVQKEIRKLPTPILDKIVTSDPWEALLILREKIPTLPSSHFLDMLYLANYPCNLLIRTTSETTATLTGTNTTTKRSFKYPQLLLDDANDQQIIWGVLYHLGKFPDLYVGDDKLPYETLNGILSLNDPRPILKFLCTNTHLWQGADKIETKMLINLANHPDFKIMEDWFSLFKGSSKLSNTILNVILNKQSLKVFWPHLITHIICSCYKKEQKNKSEKGFQGPFLHIEKLCNNFDIDKWNILSIRPGNITSNDILVLLQDLGKILDKIYPNGESSKKDSAMKFLPNCLQSDEAHITNGAQIVAHRIASIIDYLGGLTAELNEQFLNKNTAILLMKKIKSIINTIALGGAGCSIIAMDSLTMIENKIKLFQDSKYIPNVIMTMFKLNLIKAKLINQNQQGHLETYRYYTLKFNQILTLCVPTSTVLYEEGAQKKSLGEALSKLIEACSEENLIGYAANLDEFKMLFKAESKNKLQQIQQLMDDVYRIDKMTIEARKELLADINSLGIELAELSIEKILAKPETIDSEELMRILDNRRVRIEDHFYQDKAKELFLKAGFLVESLDHL